MSDVAPALDRHNPPATILVVDDEPTLREMVAYTLRREGFKVEIAVDGPDALFSARRFHPDLIVLDVMLPGFDGMQVCRRLRAESDVPIIFLSARGEEFDRVLGLELGADDYLTKPFAMRELIARIRANLRRASKPGQSSGEPARRIESPSIGVIEAGSVTIDEARKRVTVDGAPVTLKPKEFELLLYLARHAGIVLSRAALLREVWGYDFPIDSRTVDVHVRWLRRKIEIDPANPRILETVRGFGYRLNPDVGS